MRNTIAKTKIELVTEAAFALAKVDGVLKEFSQSGVEYFINPGDEKGALYMEYFLAGASFIDASPSLKILFDILPEYESSVGL